MNLLDLGRRLRRVVSWRREEVEMDEELRFHLEMEEAHNGRSGLSSEAARRQARLAFGGLDGHREAIREARGLPALEDLWRDLRYGVRQLRRRAGSTVTLVLVLALGIGANVGVFTYYHSAMNALPGGVEKNDRLVRIRGSEAYVENGDRLDSRPFSQAEVEAYRGLQEVFEEVATSRTESVAVELAGDPVEIVTGTANFVSPNYFRTLGVEVRHGPGLPSEPTDAANASTALISDDLWRSRFHSEPDLSGATLRVNGQPVSVAGVLPPDFGDRDFGDNGVGLWMTHDGGDVIAPSRLRDDGTAFPELEAIGLLRPRVDRRTATSAARVTASRTPPVEGTSNVSADVVPLLAFNNSPDFERRTAGESAYVGILTTLILLITCTNVSGLQVGIAAQRSREIAVRLSLGATRRRLLRQLLTESALISLAAAAVACVIIWLLISFLGHLVDDVPLIFDGRVILFSALFALGTGVLSGLSPALHATRAGEAEVLKNSAGSIGGTRSWLQRGLVIAQVALTQPLLVAVVGFIFAARAEIQTREAGDIGTRIAAISFNPVSSVMVSGMEPSMQFASIQAMMQRMQERFESVPGVIAVAQDQPYSMRNRLHLPGSPASGGRSTVPIFTRSVSTGFFEVMDVRILKGRALRKADEGSVVIGEELAARLYGTATALGRTVEVDNYRGGADELTVVGVVDDQTLSTGTRQAPQIYLPAGGVSATVLIRTEGPAEPMLPLLRAVASAEAPGMPIREATTLARQSAEERTLLLKAGGAVGAGGGLALLLAAIGLYGVISLAVTARRREIGIRTAMGATSTRVVGLFFRSGITLSAAGVLIGLPVALFGFRLFAESENLAFVGILPGAAAITLAVLGVAALASWVPARRAAGQDPLVALRSD